MKLLNKKAMCWAVAALAMGLLLSPAQATDVAPGIDLFVTSAPPSPGGYVDVVIPAGFFFPGSDPFVGRINLMGKPLPYSGSGPVLPAGVDTIVERLTPAGPLPVGGSAMVDIEILALSLTSSAPITVNPGAEAWDVDVCLSEMFPQRIRFGGMTIRHEFPNGGTFSADVSVTPKLIFTRVSDSLQRVIDDNREYVFLGTAGAWAHTTLNPRYTAQVAPGVEVDADCNGSVIVLPGTTPNFNAGVDANDEKFPMSHITPDEAHYTEIPQNPRKQCGNNMREGVEECDGTDDAACPGLCLPDCTCPPPPAVCGNNIREGTEECDGTDDAACPGLCQINCTCGPPPPIPTVSEWGLLILTIIGLVAGTILFGRRRLARA